MSTETTKLMVSGSRQMHPRLVTPSLTFMGRELIPQHTAKDLGMILDTNVAYDQHIYLNCILLYILSQSNKVHKACFWQTHPTITIINASVYGKQFAA